MNSAKKMNFVEKHASQETTLLEKQEKGIEKVTEIERSDETFNCPYCDKVFEDAFGLKRHKRTHPRGSVDRTGSLCCPHCGKKFANSALANRHITTVHS